MLTRDQRWVKSFACLNQRNILYHERFESKIFSKYPKTFYLVCIEIRKNNLLSETLQNLCHLQMSSIVNFSRNFVSLVQPKNYENSAFPTHKIVWNLKALLRTRFFLSLFWKKKKEWAFSVTWLKFSGSEAQKESCREQWSRVPEGELWYW